MTQPGMTAVFWATLAISTFAVLARPEAVAPWEMPSLVLDRHTVAEDVQKSEALAARLPGDPEIDRLRTLFLDHGLAELDPPYRKVDYDTRQVRIHRALEHLRSAHGPEAFEIVRASAVERFVHMFDRGRGDRSSEEDARGAVGGFEEILQRYGAIYAGVVIAPEMTVRALYKARWNLIHRAPALDGFSPIERQAYWGWLALHGWGVPLRERTEALALYREAGGANAAEAAAMFDLLEGRPERCAEILEELYYEEGELRLRNLALGARHAARLLRR